MNYFLDMFGMLFGFGIICCLTSGSGSNSEDNGYVSKQHQRKTHRLGNSFPGWEKRVSGIGTGSSEIPVREAGGRGNLL